MQELRLKVKALLKCDAKVTYKDSRGFQPEIQVNKVASGFEDVLDANEMLVDGLKDIIKRLGVENEVARAIQTEIDAYSLNCLGRTDRLNALKSSMKGN